MTDPKFIKQATQYEAEEGNARRLLVNGLNLMLASRAKRDDIEAKLAPGGELELMAAFYAAQYDRFPGGGDTVRGAFATIEVAIETIHNTMWALHQGLKSVDGPEMEMFPRITDPNPEEEEVVE